MLEYHNQNFNTPKQTTIGGQLKSLGDKFRKVANLKEDNLLTLNDMEGLMDHVTIPTNPNMFKNTKDFSNLSGKGNDNKWGNFFSLGSILPSDSPLITEDVKTSVYHFYTDNDQPWTQGLKYYGYLPLKKDHIYTLSYILRYQPFDGNFNGHPMTWNDGWIDWSFCLYGFYTTNKNRGQPLVDAKKINNNWQQYCLTFKALVDADPTTDIQWWLQSYGVSGNYPGGSLYIANIKLEEGDLATPYCE